MLFVGVVCWWLGFLGFFGFFLIIYFFVEGFFEGELFFLLFLWLFFFFIVFSFLFVGMFVCFCCLHLKIMLFSNIRIIIMESY